MENKLTTRFIKQVYGFLHSTKTISRLNFSENELADVFYTIWTINELSSYDTHISPDVQIAGYQIPDCFKGLVLPQISLGGRQCDTRLVRFSIDDEVKETYKDIKVLKYIDMIGITEAIYGSRKLQGKYILLSPIIANPKPIGEFIGRLAMNEDHVSTYFVEGQYPLISTLSGIVEPRYGGMSVQDAVEAYIVHTLHTTLVKN